MASAATPNDPILECLSFKEATKKRSRWRRRKPKSTEQEPGASGGPSGGGTDSVIQNMLRETQKEPGVAKAGDDENFMSAVILEEEVDIVCPFPDCMHTVAGGSTFDRNWRDDFMNHMITEHRFVVEHPQEIANWPMYCLCWKKLLASGGLDKYCYGFKMIPPTPPGAAAKKQPTKSEEESADSNENDDVPKIEIVDLKASDQKEMKRDDLFYMLTPKVPEDHELRRSLWQDRLVCYVRINVF